MRHIVLFSGDQKCIATINYCLSQGLHLEVVYCKTGFECARTWKYLKSIRSSLRKVNVDFRIINNSGSEFFGIYNSNQFYLNRCSEDLIFKPFVDYILACRSDVIIYSGENNRSLVKGKSYCNSFFKYYQTPYFYSCNELSEFDGAYYQYYRHLEVKHWLDKRKVIVNKVLSPLTEKEYCKAIEEGPLVSHLHGIGSIKDNHILPDISCPEKHIRLFSDNFINKLYRIMEYENRTLEEFFHADIIPEKFCSRPKKYKRFLKDFASSDLKYFKNNPEAFRIKKDHNNREFLELVRYLPSISDVMNYATGKGEFADIATYIDTKLKKIDMNGRTNFISNCA